MDLVELRGFLVAANQAGYASTRTTIKDEANGSHTIVYEADGWRFEDSYFGGEPYGGREVISRGERVEWMMLYYGWVGKTNRSNNEVYKFLRQALMHVPEDKPYRGPHSYVLSDLEYRNQVTGGPDNFSGEEVILDKGVEIYRARYFGGLVDQRPGD